MTPPRRRQRIGIALMLCGILAAGWMLYRGARFVLIDGMGSAIGDETGWPALLLLVAVFINCLALAVTGGRAIWPQREWVFTNRFFAIQTGLAVSLVLLSLGGVAALLGCVGAMAGGIAVARGFGPAMVRRSDA